MILILFAILIEINYKIANNINNGLITLSILEGADIKTVKIFLEAGGNINENFENKLNPLISACFMNNYELVKYLIDKQADVNQKLNNNTNVLILMSLMPNIKERFDNDDKSKKLKEIKIFKLLLKNIIDIDSVNDFGNNALICSCKKKL